MKYASIPWARTAPKTIASRTNTGLFAWILESLHHSRRLQAQRFLRTHRPLIATSRDSVVKPNSGDDDKMPHAERRSPVRRSSKNPGPSETTFLAIIGCVFLLSNIMVGMMVHRALPTEPGSQRAEVIVSPGD